MSIPVDEWLRQKYRETSFDVVNELNALKRLGAETSPHLERLEMKLLVIGQLELAYIRDVKFRERDDG